MTNIEVTVTQTLAWISMVFNINITTPPDIVVIPHEEMQQKMGCPVERKCKFKGLFSMKPGDPIYLSDALNLDDAYDSSVLVHELVHYGQMIRDNLNDIARYECKQYRKYEIEAYYMQGKWLSYRFGSIYDGFGRHIKIVCPEDTPQKHSFN